MQAKVAGTLIRHDCPPSPLRIARTEPRGTWSRTRKQLRSSTVPWAWTDTEPTSTSAPTKAGRNEDMMPSPAMHVPPRAWAAQRPCWPAPVALRTTRFLQLRQTPTGKGKSRWTPLSGSDPVAPAPHSATSLARNDVHTHARLYAFHVDPRRRSLPQGQAPGRDAQHHLERRG